MIPKSEDIRKVIDLFKSVLPMATDPCHLDMMEGSVKSDHHKCGTVHCVAGWFAIAIGLHKRKRIVNYEHGAQKMAIMLGFTCTWDLKKWAALNKILWGNDDGINMFVQKDAYQNRITRPNGANNLQEVINHWEEVYERALNREKHETDARD